MILAIETSQREASVALRDREGHVHEESLSPRKRHDDDLLPAIDRMFSRAGLRSADLRHGAVAVSIGPGGFTGLRIAIATAKMLAVTLNVQLVGVPSALVAAKDHQGDGPLLVALACKNDTFWLTRLERSSEFRVPSSQAASGVMRLETEARTSERSWRIAGEAGIARADAFDFSGVRAIIADEHFPDAARVRLMSASISIVPPHFSARSCLGVGERMLRAGTTTDPLRLLPVYPREPEAVTLWNQRHAGH